MSTDFRTWSTSIKMTGTDWNYLLDHGLVKPATYIITKIGAYYEAINGSTGQIDYGGPDDIGSVSGSSLVAVAQAVADNMTTGGKLFFALTGIHDFSQTLDIDTNDKIRIEGEGLATVIRGTGNFPIITITGAAPLATFRDSIEIANLTLYGNSIVNAACKGIEVTCAKFLKLQDVWIEHCYYGIEQDYLWRPDFFGVHITDVHTGIYVNSPTGNSEFSLSRSYIRDCTDGINFWDNVSGVQMNNVWITDCTGKAVNVNELQWGHFDTVLVDTCGYGWYLYPSTNQTIRGLQFDNCWIGTITNEAFYMSTYGTAGDIREIMWDNGQLQPTFTAGFFARKSIGHPIIDLQITGGIIRGGTGHGIDLGGVEGFRILGPIVRDFQTGNSYAVYLHSNVSSGIVENCDVAVNSNPMFVDPLADVAVRENRGFVTENRGYVVVANDKTGGSAIHGLDLSDIQNFQLTPYLDISQVTGWWISNVNNVSFLMGVDQDPNTNASFIWSYDE